MVMGSTLYLKRMCMQSSVYICRHEHRYGLGGMDEGEAASERTRAAPYADYIGDKDTG